MTAPTREDAVRPGDAVRALNRGPLGAIRRTRAIDTVRARISLAVDLGLLAPGERLPNIASTAAALDVAEITVRRAFGALERDGVVERRPGRNGGTFIAESPRRGAVSETAGYHEDSERVHRLIDERAVMEAGFAHFAAERVDAAALRRLDTEIRAMDDATTWAEFHEADRRYHRALAESAALPSALEMYDQVTAELYRYYLPYTLSYLRASNDDHKRIAAALGHHDAAVAARLLGAHVAELHRTMYVGLIAEPPRY
jgi:DNA-binding FadR family transcriptional regulator